jgi:hypothetical protein
MQVGSIFLGLNRNSCIRSDFFNNYASILQKDVMLMEAGKQTKWDKLMKLYLFLNNRKKKSGKRIDRNGLR